MKESKVEISQFDHLKSLLDEKETFLKSGFLTSDEVETLNKATLSLIDLKDKSTTELNLKKIAQKAKQTTEQVTNALEATKNIVRNRKEELYGKYGIEITPDNSPYFLNESDSKKEVGKKIVSKIMQEHRWVEETRDVSLITTDETINEFSKSDIQSYIVIAEVQNPLDESLVDSYYFQMKRPAATKHLEDLAHLPVSLPNTPAGPLQGKLYGFVEYPLVYLDTNEEKPSTQIKSHWEKMSINPEYTWEPDVGSETVNEVLPVFLREQWFRLSAELYEQWIKQGYIDIRDSILENNHTVTVVEISDPQSQHAPAFFVKFSPDNNLVSPSLPKKYNVKTQTYEILPTYQKKDEEGVIKNNIVPINDSSESYTQFQIKKEVLHPPIWYKKEKKWRILDPKIINNWAQFNALENDTQEFTVAVVDDGSPMRVEFVSQSHQRIPEEILNELPQNILEINYHYYRKYKRLTAKNNKQDSTFGYELIDSVYPVDEGNTLKAKKINDPEAPPPPPFDILEQFPNWIYVEDASVIKALTTVQENTSINEAHITVLEVTPPHHENPVTLIYLGRPPEYPIQSEWEFKGYVLDRNKDGRYDFNQATISSQERTPRNIRDKKKTPPITPSTEPTQEADEPTAPSNEATDKNFVTLEEVPPQPKKPSLFKRIGKKVGKALTTLALVVGLNQSTEKRDALGEIPSQSTEKSLALEKELQSEKPKGIKTPKDTSSFGKEADAQAGAINKVISQLGEKPEVVKAGLTDEERTEILRQQIKEAEDKNVERALDNEAQEEAEIYETKKYEKVKPQELATYTVKKGEGVLHVFSHILNESINNKTGRERILDYFRETQPDKDAEKLYEDWKAGQLLRNDVNPATLKYIKNNVVHPGEAFTLAIAPEGPIIAPTSEVKELLPASPFESKEEKAIQAEAQKDDTKEKKSADTLVDDPRFDVGKNIVYRTKGGRLINAEIVGVSKDVPPGRVIKDLQTNRTFAVGAKTLKEQTEKKDIVSFINGLAVETLPNSPEGKARKKIQFNKKTGKGIITALATYLEQTRYQGQKGRKGDALLDARKIVATQKDIPHATNSKKTFKRAPDKVFVKGYFVIKEDIETGDITIESIAPKG